MKKLFLFIFLVCSLSAVFAVDFGAVLGGSFSVDGRDDTKVSGNVSLAPWLSAPMGKADFFLSLGLSALYDETWQFVPELYRLELSYKPTALFGLRAGRIPWQDTSHFTAKGNFDGVDLRFNFGDIILGASGFYTGFLYSGTADINETAGDPIDHFAPLDYADFAATYFAPRRIIASIYGEFPSLVFRRGDLYAGILAQFDLSGAAEAFHTQYLLLRYTHIYKQLDINAAFALELEKTVANGVKAAFAFALEGGWNFNTPVFVKDRLSLAVRYSSGEGPHAAAFFPIIREAQGTALKPCFAGMMLVHVNYEARILESLTADLGLRYFIRTDGSSFDDPYNSAYLNSDSYALGMEIDASVFWVPFSDLSLSLSGGVFLPGTGGAFDKGAPPIWTISLGAVFSF